MKLINKKKILKKSNHSFQSKSDKDKSISKDQNNLANASQSEE
jgi:hypothetical protein